MSNNSNDMSTWMEELGDAIDAWWVKCEESELDHKKEACLQQALAEVKKHLVAQQDYESFRKSSNMATVKMTIILLLDILRSKNLNCFTFGPK